MEPKRKYNTYDKLQDAPKKKAMAIEDVIDNIGFGRSQILLGLMISTVWISDGMEIMVVAILGPTLEYEWHITPAQQAFLTMWVFIGFIIGSPIFGYISDKYGRKTSLVCSSMWTLFYGALNAAAPNFMWILFLRMLLGVGIAGGLQSMAFYIEFLPRKNRGKTALLLTVTWTIGGLLNVGVAMLVVQYSWRYWLLLSSVPGLMFLLCSPFIPESPMYELACGRKEEAVKILKSLATGNGQTLPDIDLIQRDVKSRGRISDLFIPQMRKNAILIGIVFFCTGFIYYGVALFSTYLIRAGNTCSSLPVGGETWQCGLQGHLLTTSNFHELLWTTSAEFPGLLLTILVIDDLGRKWTALVETTIVGFCLLALYICMTGSPMVILLFAVRGLALATFDLMFLYVGEIFPTEVRAIATGYGSGMARFGALVTPYFAQVLFSYSVKMGLAAYVFIVCLSVLLYSFLPETKGRHMADSLEG